jgi:hypothetical protein
VRKSLPKLTRRIEIVKAWCQKSMRFNGFDAFDGRIRYYSLLFSPVFTQLTSLFMICCDVREVVVIGGGVVLLGSRRWFRPAPGRPL